MIRLILIAVIGLLVGVGGGSAVSVMKAKKAFAAQVALHAKVVADSLEKSHVDGQPQVAATTHGADSSAVGDSTGAGATPTPAQGATHETPSVNGHSAVVVVGSQPSHDSVDATPHATPPPPKIYSRATQVVESNGSPSARPRAAGVPALAPKPIPTASPSAGVVKVAKIFAAMAPKDAAKVLEQLDDSEVQSVVASLAEKQAAAILQHFPPPRAALISKGVLRSTQAKP